MKYNLKINLPEHWTSEMEDVNDADGLDLIHYIAIHAKSASQDTFEIFLGDMPEGSSAEDEAYASYAQTLGYEDDEDEDAVHLLQFAGKEAFGYDFEYEEGGIVAVICLEIVPGALAIVIASSTSDAHLKESIRIASGLQVTVI